MQKFLVHQKRVIKEIFKKIYISLLEYLLKKKYIYVLIILPIIHLSFQLFNKIPKEFAPQEDRGVFIMVMESPEGSTFENNCQSNVKIRNRIS